MKDILGYEGLYAITSCGKVWSYRRKMFLKPSISQKGYAYVSLMKDGASKKFRVHRLVAEAFIPNPENKPEVNHINEVKTDNYVSNLEWATRVENMNAGTVQTRMKQMIQEKVSHPVYCIELRKGFCSIVEAARELGVHQANLGKAIANGKPYKGYTFRYWVEYYWRNENE